MADADMAQVAEHILGKDEVTSSNLVISSIIPVVIVTMGIFVFVITLKTEPKMSKKYYITYKLLTKYNEVNLS